MTKLYGNQVPLFPTIYTIQVQFDGTDEGAITWDSEWPVRPNQYKELTHRIHPRAVVYVRYQLHAYSKRQHEEQVVTERLWRLVALAAPATIFGLTWVVLVQRRERQRARQQAMAEFQAAQNERLLLQEQHRHEETERALLEQRLATQVAEQRALELKSQMFANISIMAGSYAHNIKNLLVRPNDLLSRCLEADSLSTDQTTMLHEVQETLGTVTERLQQILQTVRRDPTKAEPTRLDLNAVLRDLERTWRDLGRDRWKLDFVLDLAEGPCEVAGDLSHIQQAIENLLFNASDATFEQRVRLRDEAHRIEGSERKQALIAAAGWKGRVVLRSKRIGDEVILEVSDNGAGMTEEVRRRCIEPHFSTKRDNALFEGLSTGMGLGLSFVVAVLEHHHSALEIDSELGRGTTFSRSLCRSVRWRLLRESRSCDSRSESPTLRRFLCRKRKRLTPRQAASVVWDAAEPSCLPRGLPAMKRFFTLGLLPLLLAADDPARVLPPGKAPADARLTRVRLLTDKDFFFTPPTDLKAWETRRRELREQILVATGLWPMPEKTPLNAVIHGKIDRDEYTIEKVFFASHPGHYVTGNLYRPKGKSEKLPAVLVAHGHWTNARLADFGAKVAEEQLKIGAEKTAESARFIHQAMCVQLARMGCVVFQYDMVGHSDSKDIGHAQGFLDADAQLRLQSFMGLQTWNSIRSLDFVLGLPEVDPKRVAMTGASGGGTQTFILGAVDDRLSVAFPAVMVSTAMQGGCVCENCSLLRQGTGNVEMAAIFAPKPLGMTGADDWTKEIETKGLPELKALYKLYGAEDKVMAKCFPEFKHNYNQVSREVMYNWFNRHLDLGQKEPVVERPFVPVPPAELSVFDDKHSHPADAVNAERLRQYLTESSDKQIAALRPTDAKSLEEYRKVMGTRCG